MPLRTGGTTPRQVLSVEDCPLLESLTAPGTQVSRLSASPGMTT